MEKLHWLVGGTVERCSYPGGIWTPIYTLLSPPFPLSPLSLALSFFPSLILSLSPLFVSRLPSLRFYPVVKRRRVTWTQERSIRGSPTRDLVSLVLSHSLSLSYSIFLSLIFSVLFSVSVSFFFSISHGSISIRFASLCDIVVNLWYFDARTRILYQTREKRSRLFSRDWRNFSLLAHSRHPILSLARIYM